MDLVARFQAIPDTAVYAAVGVLTLLFLVIVIADRRGRRKPRKSARSKRKQESLVPIIAYEDDDDDQVTRVGVGSVPVADVSYDADAVDDEVTSEGTLFDLDVSGMSDRGLRRKRNEDALLLLGDEGVFAVADGMGGYAGGDVASKLAVEALASTFRAGSFSELPRNVPRRAGELAFAVTRANSAVYRAAEADPRLSEMGTTLVAARFCKYKRRLYIANIGDSRCYRMRGRQLQRITQDHTMAALGVEGKGAEQLSRALGIGDNVPSDVMVLKPEPGDTYMLCSDGLTKMVREELIAAVLDANVPPNVAADELVRLANANGGMDNVTVVVIRVAAKRSSQRKLLAANMSA